MDIYLFIIFMALFAGVLTASSILKRNLTNDIIKAIREKAEPVA